MAEERLNYGGQAVIEGVMMRGSRSMAVAVRQPDGEIVLHTEPLDPKIYQGRLSKIPFLRALTSLWDVLVLGIRTLMYSADVALGEEEDVEFSGPIAWGTLAVSLALGVGLFFVLPLLLVGLVDRFIASSFVSNVVEGVIRMALGRAFINRGEFLAGAAPRRPAIDQDYPFACCYRFEVFLGQDNDCHVPHSLQVRYQERPGVSVLTRASAGVITNTVD